MLVKERMSRQPILAAPDMTMSEALAQMKKEHVRRMPVIDKHGKLIGIVSDKDLLHASPSPATTLSVWEIPALLAKIKVEDVMTKKVITVTEDTPLEDAARIMVDNKIGGLPVVHGDKVVGIITETDLFKIFLELLGARHKGVRITMLVIDVKGQLAKIAQAIAAVGGNIIAMGEVQGTDSTNYQVMIKVVDVPQDKLVAALTPYVIKIEDVREV
ncbi:MAG TPA: CBS domain-containing protein [Anaerolineae bacterium]|nr:CBS domain-containing protein [Anaerolineae bacterium]